MTTTLRIDDALKRQCDSVLDEMGLNFSCAITIFLKELTRRRAMPFAIRATGASPLHERYADKSAGILSESARRSRRLFAEMRGANEREWTMDEIDAEIAASRAERQAVKAVR